MIIKTILGLTIVTFMGCANNQNNLTLKSGKTLDKNLVGTFSGYLSNEENVRNVSWTINRKEGGFYTLSKQFRVRGRTTKINTEGIWWTENGNYYQQNTNINETEIYSYKVESTKKIDFKSTSTEENFEYIELKE